MLGDIKSILLLVAIIIGLAIAICLWFCRFSSTQNQPLTLEAATRHYENVVRLSGVNSAEKSNALMLDSAVVLAQDVNAWPFTVLILSGGSPASYSHADHAHEDDTVIVPLHVISMMIESIPINVNAEVCIALLDWLDVEVQAMYSTKERFGILGEKKIEKLSEAPRDAVRKYFITRYGVDYELDKEAWMQHIKADARER